MPTWPGTIDPKHTDDDRLATMKEFAQDFAEPWKSTFLWIPEGTPSHGSNLAFWETIPWDNHKGKVTLAGDSAHAMPPRKMLS
jgi:2-polyprenyl-6-methoxyphenol hydroxylase-like FAD-dependent oxidoreductase